MLHCEYGNDQDCEEGQKQQAEMSSDRGSLNLRAAVVKRVEGLGQFMVCKALQYEYLNMLSLKASFANLGERHISS